MPCIITHLRLRLSLLLVAGLCLPLALYGQEEPRSSTSSIVGRVFWRIANRSSTGQVVEVYQIPQGEAYHVTLVAGGDTLRARLNSSGRFDISEIDSGHVDITIAWSGTNTLTKRDTTRVYLTGSFEIVPGENIVIIPWSSAPAFEPPFPLVTMDGDTWNYDYSDSIAIGDFAAEMLKQLPGVTINKRNRTISIPGEGIYRSESDGIYVFALKPSSQ